MIVSRLIEAIGRRPTLTRWLAIGFPAVLILWDAVLLDKGKAHTEAERLPGFWSLFGLAAAVAIIVFAKWLGQHGISTGEDYYD